MIRSAAKIAKESNHHVFKMGAVIVKGSRILSAASNKINRGCRYTHNKKWIDSLHAEQHAIIKLLKHGRMSDLIGADLYVTRINKRGSVMLSKPCGYCLEAAKAVGIRNIFFTNNLGETEVIKC